MLAVLGTAACGHGADPTGPDTVAADERATHLTEMKTRLADPPRLTPMRISDVIGLPTYPRAYTRAPLLELSAVEERGATVAGYVTRVRRMDDGDYHRTRATRGAARRGRCTR